MSGRKLRWLGFRLLATAGAGLMGLTSVMHAAFAYGDDTALVMGGSGIPVPPPIYVDAANDLYLHLPTGSVQPLTTPEGLYPLTGVNSLQLDLSVAQGETTLNNAIMQQIADGNDVDVFGYSQSADISSLETAELQADGVKSSDVSFTLVGDEMIPMAASRKDLSGCPSPALVRRTAAPLRAIFTRPTFTRSNTTASPTSRDTPSTCSPTSTPTWAAFTSTSRISTSRRSRCPALSIWEPSATPPTT